MTSVASAGGWSEDCSARVVANEAKRTEIIELLTRAYWMEMETVMSYVANAANLDGIRAEEVAESLAADVNEELGHARQFAERIKELYGTPPGSAEFTPDQPYLQPPADATDVVTVIEGVIRAESGALPRRARSAMRSSSPGASRITSRPVRSP